MFGLDGTAMPGMGVLIFGICVYFFPWIVAILKNHHNRGAICLLNLLGGWTILFWFAALIWACTSKPKPQVIVVQSQAEADKIEY